MKYLSFELGTETFGVPVELVQEVLEHTRVTRVPRCPDYLLGIINLRGSIVAVMDLRRRLGIAEREITVTTRFVVLNLTIEEQPTQVAMMADTVDEVVDIAAEEIDPAPIAGGDASAATLVGVAKLRDRMVLLLDAELLLTGEVLAETFDLLDQSGTS